MANLPACAGMTCAGYNLILRRRNSAVSKERVLRVHIDDDTTTDLTLQDGWAQIRQVAQFLIHDHCVQLVEGQVCDDAVPGSKAVGGWAHDTVDAQQVYTAQQEGDYGCGQFRAACQTDGSDGTTIADLRSDLRQHAATNGINAARPQFLFQRFARRFCQFLTRDDLAGTQVFQIVRCFGSSGHSGNFITQFRQDRGGNGADPTSRPGDQHRRTSWF